MNMHRGAVFSPCRTWRYSLWRGWDENLPKLVAVMLNPSMADDEHDDPTTTFMLNWARRRGYGDYMAVNLFALIGTDPNCLIKHPDPVGPVNDLAITKAVQRADVVLVAWGSMSFLPVMSRLHGRRFEVGRLLRADRDAPPICFGLTKNGRPRFPRALRRDVETVTYTL